MNKKALDKSVSYINSWLAFKYDHEEIPGYAVAISHKGKIIMNEAYGFANLENKTKLKTDHLFRIASHSKTFTTTAVMQLQEQGKFRIDDYLADYVSWLKEHKDKRWQKVTIRQILSHGAGIIRDGLDSNYWQLDRPFPDSEQFKNEILEAKLVIDNNLRHKYSNFGYSLLGNLIESASGISYNKYVQINIIDALSLKNTGPEYNQIIDGKLVTGYSRREPKSRIQIAHVDTKAMSPATGFYSATEDLCRYFTAQFVGSRKLLSDESKKEMQRVQFRCKTSSQDSDQDYGLGFELEYLGKRKTISHGGGFPGHITKTIADPKDELVVTVLTNCLGSPASMIAKGIFGIFDYFTENVSSDKPKHDLKNLEGRYINLWGMSEIVVTGDKVIAGYPNSWQPFQDAEKLEYVSENTLKIVETDSFSSEQELLKFKVKDGKVTALINAGSTMLPEAAWNKKIKTMKKIG